MRSIVLAALAALLAAAATTAQSTPTTIPLPIYGQSYPSYSVRGFACWLPVDLTVTGLRVPDESRQGKQHVCLYRCTSSPPIYPSSANLTPVFSRVGAPSGTTLACNVKFRKGEWLVALGACSTTPGAMNYMSYGGTTWRFNTSIFGKSVTLVRAGTPSNIATRKGSHPVFQEHIGVMSRVEVYVASIDLHAAGTPAPGQRIVFSLISSADAGLPYQLGSSFGAGPIPLGTRKIELSADKLLELSVSGLAPTVFPGYSGRLDGFGAATGAMVVPNHPSIRGVRINTVFVTLDPSAPFGVRNISNRVLVVIY